ncbi:MAG: tail fiber protein, partial [Clostridia bacterium]|nr:tail fiber protein [Clostridia bacterium]
MATNPTLLTMPIAKNGQKNTIPATQAAAGDGLLSQSTGFPPETALPLGAGGKAPTREDFNGALNLLSNIAFYSQKGWTFQYDANQAYYKGCIVMDATDGKRYECINDVAAGTILPSADTDNDYWREFATGGVPLGSILAYGADAAEPPYGFLFCEGQAVSRTLYPDLFDLYGTKWGAGDGSTTFNIPNLIEAAMLNGSYTKTSYTTAGSATFVAPKTGFYKITVKGAGGGGGAGNIYSTTGAIGGAAGGEGGTTIGYEKMTAGDTISVVVGAGGVGASTMGGGGSNGGSTTATVNNTTYTGGGATNAFGGSGTITGACGGIGDSLTNVTAMTARGGTGGGTGGGFGGASTFSSTQNGVNGGGGGGGGAMLSGNKWANGGNGGDGYATIEYIGISTKYMLKAYDAPTPSSAQIDLSQYASDLAARLTREQTPAFNKRDIVT